MYPSGRTTRAGSGLHKLKGRKNGVYGNSSKGRKKRGNRTAGRSILLLCLFAFSFGFFRAYAEERSPTPWTLAVYLCGSNLESANGDATEDLLEMLGTPFDDRLVNLYVLTGGASAWNPGRYGMNEDEEYEPVADESGSYLQPREDALQIFRIENRRDETPVRINNREILNRMVPVQTAENRPMSDGNTLSWFLDRVISLSPTEHMMVELWDHGAGPVRGVEHDEATDRYMRISDLRQALEKACEARQAAGLSGRLDMIGFDCCLMGNAEILVELQETAEYMVASELSEWGNGWDYSWLSVFSSPEARCEILNADWDLNMNFTVAAADPAFSLEIGKAIVNRLPHQSKGISTWEELGNLDSATLALYRLSGGEAEGKQAELAERLDALGRTMTEARTGTPGEAIRLLRSVETMEAVCKDLGLVDLRDMAMTIMEACGEEESLEPVRSAARDLLDLLREPAAACVEDYTGEGDIVLYRGSTREQQVLCSLSVFFPGGETNIQSGEQEAYYGLALSRVHPAYADALLRVSRRDYGAFEGKLSAECDPRERLFTAKVVLPGAGEAAVTEQINRLASMNSVFTYRPKDSEYTYKLGEYSVTKAWEQNRFSSDFSGFWPVIGGNLTTMSIDKDLKVRMPVWGNRWEEPEELRGHLEDVTGAGARLVLDQAVFYDGLAWGRPFIPDAGYSFIPCLEVTPESYLEGGDTVRYPRVRLKKDQFVTTEKGKRYYIDVGFRYVPAGEYTCTFSSYDTNGVEIRSEPVTMIQSDFPYGEYFAESIQDQPWTGEPVTPVPGIWHNNRLMKDEYDVSYEYVNNVNPGVATVYVIFSKNGEEKGVIPVWFLIEKGGGGEQD